MNSHDHGYDQLPHHGRIPTLKEVLSRAERRKKYASFTHEIRMNQDRRHLHNDLQRIEGMLYHRLRPGLQEHALFERQRSKIQSAITATMF